MKKHTNQSTNSNVSRHHATLAASEVSLEAKQRIAVVDESQPPEILVIQYRVPGTFPLASNQPLQPGKPAI